MVGEIHDMSAGDLVAAFAARKLSPVALRAVFARIREANSSVNAFCYTLEEEALAQARASEARWRKAAPLGAIDGVPATIKDLADIAGYPMRTGSLSTDATPAAEDSPATARLRAAGAVLIGKTATPEFGWAGVTHSPLTGITRNPWDRTKTSGGVLRRLRLEVDDRADRLSSGLGLTRLHGRRPHDAHCRRLGLDDGCVLGA